MSCGSCGAPFVLACDDQTDGKSQGWACSACGEMAAAAAVRCVACGFDKRTGRKTARRAAAHGAEQKQSARHRRARRRCRHPRMRGAADSADADHCRRRHSRLLRLSVWQQVLQAPAARPGCSRESGAGSRGHPEGDRKVGTRSSQVVAAPTLKHRSTTTTAAPQTVVGDGSPTRWATSKLRSDALARWSPWAHSSGRPVIQRAAQRGPWLGAAVVRPVPRRERRPCCPRRIRSCSEI